METPHGGKFQFISLEDAGFVTALMVNGLCRTVAAVSLSSFVPTRHSGQTAAAMPNGGYCSWGGLFGGRFLRVTSMVEDWLLNSKG